MIVEDEALIAYSLEDALRDFGMDVAGPFASCAEALACLCGSQVPALAVVDAVLRDGTCLELARELTRRHVPFLIYSGRDAFEEHPPELNGIPWLEKPCPPEAVAKAAARLLAPS